MDTQTWIYIMVFGTFALYIGIALWARAGTTSEYYVASKGSTRCSTVWPLRPIG